MIEQYLPDTVRLDDALLYETDDGDVLVVLPDDTDSAEDRTGYQIDLFAETAEQVDVNSFSSSTVQQIQEPDVDRTD